MGTDSEAYSVVALEVVGEEQPSINKLE